PSGESTVAIMGRQPIATRPPEFAGVSAMTMELVSSWIESMAKDLLELGSAAGDPFVQLSERWRWNLYIVDAVTLSGVTNRANLLSLAKKQYRRFVGVDLWAPARRRPALSKPRRGVEPEAETIPAWMAEEFLRRRMQPEFVSA